MQSRGDHALPAPPALSNEAVRRRLLRDGPIGAWRTVPGTPAVLADDVIRLDADGTGELPVWSLIAGEERIAFTWRTEAVGVLVCRPVGGDEDTPAAAVAFDRRSTDVGSFWVMRHVDRDGFWWLGGPVVAARTGDTGRDR